MLVTLTANESWSGELEAEVSIQHPASGNVGGATITIPRPHAALAADSRGRPRYLDMDGGFIVTVIDERFGVWRGVADTPSVALDRVELTVFDLAAWFTIVRVGNATGFTCVPAGTIVRQAWLEAVGKLGLAVLPLGGVTLSGGLVDEYRFSNQTMADVLSDMSAITTHEWALDSDGALIWGGFVGDYYPSVLCDDSDALQAAQTGSITDMALHATARNTLGQEASYVVLERIAGAFWPADADGSAT